MSRESNAPVEALSSARRCLLLPPIEVKEPPTNKEEPENSISTMVPFTDPASKEVIAPVVGSSAAIRSFETPPSVEKLPPTKMAPPFSSITRMVEFAFGSQAVSVPSVSKAAKRFLVVPPTKVKLPPAYKVPLKKAKVSTVEFGSSGVNPPSNSPVVASILASRLAETPFTVVKLPPM